MSKASSALRRSGIRLRSLGSGRTPLNLLISEQSNTRQKYKDLISAQITLAQSLDQWSQIEENPAVQDVLHHVCELNQLWAEAQTDFVVALKKYKSVYENVREMEKKLEATRKQLNSLEEKERKLQKELLKGPKDGLATQEKLRQTTDSKSLAQVEVSGLERENEAVKLMTLRAGLLDLSQAWQCMASKSHVLADSQKELAVLMPDIGSVRVQDVPTYTGTRESSRILYNTRTKLDQIQPPKYTSSVAELYPDPTSPPAYSELITHSQSAGNVTIRGENRRRTLPNTLTPKNLDTLNSVDQYCDSFDSYESD